MFDVKNYFQSKNAPIEKDYQKNLNRVQEILIETQNHTENKYNSFFNHLAQWILLIAEYEKDFSFEYIKSQSFDSLKEYNQALYTEILPENYKKSYANPTYAVSVFGEKTGQLLCAFYSNFRQFITFAANHMVYKINRAIIQYIQLYDLYLKEGENYDEMKKIVTYPLWAEIYESRTLMFDMRYNPEYSHITDFLNYADLNDLRYLFFYGNYITEVEIKTAEFLNKLPQEKIDTVMKQTAAAYIEGFREGGKDYSKRKNVNLITSIGMERLAKSLIEELKAYGLTTMISVINSKSPNQQFAYDHRFDSALVIDEEFVKHSLTESERAISDYEKYISQCSGSIYYDSFGEDPFAPENKKEAMKLSPEQLEHNKTLNNQYSMLFYKAYKREEASFCIIGFPTPEIGEQFEEIFDKTIDINMLDHKEYLRIQQLMIDALDKGDYARIIGKGKNQTDLTIKLPKLNNPEKETNFCNCGATVNIPVGEVFNTPQLTGTHGRLHISETFLNGLFYKELTLDFEDGCISNYSCANFDNEEDNKKYIEENLIFPHKSLPIGEFAIGTNTLAYVMAKKFDILSVLPILIIEKMGPHIAIGDTCYSWEEDTPVFNPDGKEIISRDNERSILRKEDTSKAYTQCHVDITLPYDEIELIEAVTGSGEHIEIIRDSRFVLAGTEILNKAFEELK
jgi:leucyl aminopeptidase (aminopeptidase T)